MTFTEKNMFSDQIISHRHNCHLNKRVPFCVSGSITVEAALTIPIFFLAVTALCYTLEVMAVRTSIRSGMQSAGKRAAVEAYLKPVLIPGEIEEEIVRAVGEDRLDRSIVADGSRGIHCEHSYMSPLTGIMEIRTSYEVRLPIKLFGEAAVPMEESCRIKGWNGYEKAPFSHGDESVVYITETGMVYHRDYHCTYLELSIKAALLNEVKNFRNKNQEKYHPCEKCGAINGGQKVYITDYGNKYHSSLDCSGLKRTIYAVPVSEAVGKGVCSKCG